VLDPSFQGGTITNLTLDGATLSGTNTVSGSLALYNSSVNGMLTGCWPGAFARSAARLSARKRCWTSLPNGVSEHRCSGRKRGRFQGPVTNQGKRSTGRREISKSTMTAIIIWVRFGTSRAQSGTCSAINPSIRGAARSSSSNAGFCAKQQLWHHLLRPQTRQLRHGWMPKAVS